MQIESNGRNELTIIGNIKSIEDSIDIKNGHQRSSKGRCKKYTIENKRLLFNDIDRYWPPDETGKPRQNPHFLGCRRPSPLSASR